MFVFLPVSLLAFSRSDAVMQEAVKSPVPAREEKKKPDFTLHTCDVSIRVLTTIAARVMLLRP